MSRGEAALARRAWKGMLGVGRRHFESGRGSSEAMGLTPVLQHSLRALASTPPGPMSQLASRLGVDAAWVTDVVDSLEARGFVVRVASPKDRRVKIVEVTEAGRAMQRTLDRRLATPPPELLRLPLEDLEALARIFQRVESLAAADAALPGVGGGPARATRKR